MLAIFWAVFALSIFMWLAIGEQPEALAALRLFLIAFISIWLPAGLAGKGRWSLLPTMLLLALTIYCGLTLYQTTELWRYPIRLAMHLLQCGILSYWAINCWMHQNHPST